MRGSSAPRFVRQEADHAAEEREGGPEQVRPDYDRKNPHDGVQHPARAIPSAVDEQAPEQGRDPEDDRDGAVEDAPGGDGAEASVEGAETASQDEGAPEEPQQEADDREVSLLGRERSERPFLLHPFSNPPEAHTPAGSPG